MAIKENISYRGQQSVSTLGGQISLNEGAGTLTVRDPNTQRIVTVVDINGFMINNNEGTTTIGADGFLTTNGIVSTKVNPSGITQNDGTNDRILLGDDA